MKARNELIEATAGVFAAMGFLGGFLPKILFGPIGIVLAVFGLLGIALFVIMQLQDGKSAPRIILFALVISALPFAILYGFMWYMTVYLPNSGQPLITFPATK